MLRLHRPQPGVCDYFQFQIFACNFIGLTVRVMGYGFELKIRIHDPNITRR